MDRDDGDAGPAPPAANERLLRGFVPHFSNEMTVLVPAEALTESEEGQEVGAEGGESKDKRTSFPPSIANNTLFLPMSVSN